MKKDECSVPEDVNGRMAERKAQADEQLQEMIEAVRQATFHRGGKKCDDPVHLWGITGTIILEGVLVSEEVFLVMTSALLRLASEGR